MAEFIAGIVDVVGGIFEAIVSALGSTGNLIFTIGEGGAISGITGFGWLLVVALGLPLATWAISKVFTLVNGMLRRR